VSITHRPLFTPGESGTGTHCTGGWVGPGGDLDAVKIVIVMMIMIIILIIIIVLMMVKHVYKVRLF
jgi:uncharacterized membrane protein